MTNFVALRAAIFFLSTKNLSWADDRPPPPGRARVKNVENKNFVTFCSCFKKIANLKMSKTAYLSVKMKLWKGYF